MKQIKNLKLSESLKKAYREGRRSKIPWNKGIPLSEETKKKIGKSVSISLKKAYAEGRRNLTMSDAAKKKMSEAKLGKPSPKLGKKLSKETKEKISQSLIGKYVGENALYKGPCSEATKEKLRQYKGEKAANWRGGIANLPYSPDWKEISQLIRERDNYTCKQCGKIGDEKYGISVHHIDYNKKNNGGENLITLCYKCHSSTNFSRDWWTMYFDKNEIIREAYSIGNIIW